MKCRIDVNGRKIWVDANNAYNTRPPSVDIVLFRDGVELRNTVLNSTERGNFTFPCLAVWNTNQTYTYTVDEREIPVGYRKIVNGHNITNVLNEIEINGTKTWVDNDNAAGARPTEITVNLLQNGVQIDTTTVDTSDDTLNVVDFSFGQRPYADDDATPYVYTVVEDAVADYGTTVDGLNIVNTYLLMVVPFTFTKTNAATTMGLEGASFELLQGGVAVQSALSDVDGVVTFEIYGDGNYQLQESLPPAGFMDDVTVYQVDVASDGTVTVDGQPQENFAIANQPTPFGMTLSRATVQTAAYQQAPNAWALHGTVGDTLFMIDKINIQPEVTPTAVRWDSGTRDIAHFNGGGGQDITATYANGVPVAANGVYTVYALFANGYARVTTVTIDKVRDGSVAMPYLLIDYATAAAQEATIDGIGQFTPEFMAADDDKLTKNYELYEDIDMTGKTWQPLGTIKGTYDIDEGFVGNLEGNNHQISNVEIVDAEFPAGFFRSVGGNATLANFTISGKVDSYAAGGIAGLVRTAEDETITIDNVHFKGTISDSAGLTKYVGSGGIAAIVVGVGGNTVVNNCTVDGTVYSRYCAGGIVGTLKIYQDTTAEITNCTTRGELQNDIINMVSGIVGETSIHDGVLNVENCVNFMNAEAEAICAGIMGLGYTTGTGKINVLSCINRGDLKSTKNGYALGGIVGAVGFDTFGLTVKNCYNTGRLEGKSDVGGIIATQISSNVDPVIENCYNVGTIVSSVHPAGGIASRTGTLKNCASIGDSISAMSVQIARIVPKTSYTGTNVRLENNSALQNMAVLNNGVQKTLVLGATADDGANVTKSDATSQTLYQTGLGWDFADTWTFGNGAYTLPIIKTIPLDLQPNTLPTHLV